MIDSASRWPGYIIIILALCFFGWIYYVGNRPDKTNKK